MNFLCPNCKAKYKIADDKVAGRNHARMKCKKCDLIIEFRRQQNGEFTVSGSLDLGRPFSENPRPVVEPALAPQRPAPPRPTPPSARQTATAAANVVQVVAKKDNGAADAGALAGYFKQSLSDVSAEATPPPEETDDEWFVGLNSAPIGPLSIDEVKDRIVTGQVGAATLAWRDGFEEWQPVRTFPEFAAVFNDLPKTLKADTDGPTLEAQVAVAAVEEPRRVVQIDPPSERMSWAAPKRPSMLPRALLLGVALLLAGTIGYVVNNPKPVVKYVEVPVNAPPEPTPAAIVPAEQRAQVDPAAATATPAPAPTQIANKAAPSQGEPKLVEEAKPQPTASGGLLSGLAALQGGPVGPQAAKGEAVAPGNQLDADSVQRTVQRYSQSVRRTCWQPALDGRTQDAPSTARVMVTITVAGSGEVQNVSSEGDPKGYPGLARCIEGRVRQWRFPASGGTTTVKVPFVFAAQ